MFVTQLFEASGKTAVLTYGRMNPPTIGHQKLIDAVLSIPGDHYIFVSHTQDNKKNPLSAQEKLSYLAKMYPGEKAFHAASPENPTIITAASNLYKQGYTDLIIVVGADRVAAFEKLFNDYNGKFNPEGQGYKFNTIKFVSAGDRDPDADGAEGMSASKMREAAVAGDLESFKQGLHPALHKVADGMMQKIAAVLGSAKKKKVKEDFQNPTIAALVKAVRMRGMLPAGGGEMGDKEIARLYMAEVDRARRMGKRQPEEHARQTVLSMVRPMQRVGEDRVTPKQPKKGSQKWLSQQKQKEWYKNNPPVEPGDQMYGTAKILPRKVAEEHNPQDTVTFELDSENSYNHVMDKFGSVISWEGESMVTPRKYWGSIQELALAAGGEAYEIGSEEFMKEEHNPQDTVTFDVPLLIRMMEFAREDAKDDMEIHDVVTKLIQMSADGKTLSMDKYNSIVSPELHESIQRFNEATGLKKRVKIVSGSGKGKTGTVGEVRHGQYKGAPKMFTIDIDGGGNIQCSKDQLRLIKDEQVNEYSPETHAAHAAALHKKLMPTLLGGDLPKAARMGRLAAKSTQRAKFPKPQEDNPFMKTDEAMEVNRGTKVNDMLQRAEAGLASMKKQFMSLVPGKTNEAAPMMSNYNQRILDKALASFEKAKADPNQEKNPLSHDKNGVYIGDKYFNVKKTTETVVQGFGDMRPDQVKREIEDLTKEMHQYARNGDMKAVSEYIRKLEPFLAAAKKPVKESIRRDVKYALKVGKRNAI